MRSVYEIKEGEVGWRVIIILMRDTRNVYKIVVGNPEGRDHFGDIGVDDERILR
jgi:hypothetical protein